MTFSYLDTEPTRSWPAEFVLGINRYISQHEHFPTLAYSPHALRNPPNYYAPYWVFVDTQKSAGWSVTASPNYDSNWYPLNINYTNSPQWLIMAPLGPYGNYSVFGNGTGAIGLAKHGRGWTDPTSKVNLPNSVGTPIVQPWQVGMYYTSLTDPIR